MSAPGRCRKTKAAAPRRRGPASVSAGDVAGAPAGRFRGCPCPDRTLTRPAAARRPQSFLERNQSGRRETMGQRDGQTSGRAGGDSARPGSRRRCGVQGSPLQTRGSERETQRQGHGGDSGTGPRREVVTQGPGIGGWDPPAPLTEAADLAPQAQAAALLRDGAQHVLQRTLLGLRVLRERGIGTGTGGEGGRPGPEPRGRGRRRTSPARRPRGGHAGPRLIARAAPAGAPGAPRRLRPDAARREHQGSHNPPLCAPPPPSPSPSPPPAET